MNWVVVRLVGALFVLAALATGASYMRTLHTRLMSANRQVAEAQARIANRDRAIEQIQQSATRKAVQQAKAIEAQDSIASKLVAIQLTNRRLTNENASLRAWADTRLPDDVVRMHASPALTGANDYLERVSIGDSMRTARDGAADER